MMVAAARYIRQRILTDGYFAFRKTQLPMHGSRKELGKGLVNKILKDLGLR